MKEKWKLPQECVAMPASGYETLQRRKLQFSDFKYREIGYTTFVGLFWDPRNFHHDALSR